MSWVVIIDNGQQYSDHDHQTVLACASEAEANAAVEAFNSWVKRISAEAESRDMADRYQPWGKEWLPPFWFSNSAWDNYPPWSIEQYSAAAIKVPSWAETCP